MRKVDRHPDGAALSHRYYQQLRSTINSVNQGSHITTQTSIPKDEVYEDVTITEENEMPILHFVKTMRETSLNSDAMTLNEIDVTRFANMTYTDVQMAVSVATAVLSEMGDPLAEDQGNLLSRTRHEHVKFPKDLTGEALIFEQWSKICELKKCMICCDLLATPVITSCGHSYCGICWDEYTQGLKNDVAAKCACPFCRKSVPHHTTPEKTLNSLIDAEVEALPWSIYKAEWILRKKRFQELTATKIQREGGGEDWWDKWFDLVAFLVILSAMAHGFKLFRSSTAL